MGSRLFPEASFGKREPWRAMVPYSEWLVYHVIGRMPQMPRGLGERPGASALMIDDLRLMIEVGASRGETAKIGVMSG